MGKRIGRTPLFPDYTSKKFPNRRLAIMKGSEIYVETGTLLTVESFSHFISLLFSENLMVFVDSLTRKEEFAFLAESIRYPKATTLANDDGWPLAIRYTGKRGASRWVIPSSTWERKCNGSFVSDMRKTFNFVGCCKPTPGSLGGSLLRRSWKMGHFQRHTAPNVLCNVYLRTNGTGGRCDTLVKPYKETQEVYPSLLELDGATFYLAHILRLPTGTSRRFLKDHCEHYATYFAQCVVTIHEELPLGPFPVKRKKGNIVYPTLPGTYITHLWKEQVEDCRLLGLDVTIDGGYGWDSFTYDMTSIARYLYACRMHFAGKPLEQIFKKIIVAMIGHFGMRNIFHTLVNLEDAQEYEQCALDEYFHPQNYAVREEHDYTTPSMLHWFQYNLMMCARTLFWMAYPYAEQGKLISTNYDAIIVRETNERGVYAEKHSPEALMCEMGDWRWQELTNVKIHGDRSLDCDQKTTLPGVPVESR